MVEATSLQLTLGTPDRYREARKPLAECPPAANVVASASSWGDYVENTQLILIAVVAITALVIIFLYSRRKREEAVKDAHRREIQSYEDAKKDYEKALKAIEDHADRPMVLDLITDISEEPFAEIAGEAPFHIEFGLTTKVLDRIKSATESQPLCIIVHTLGGFSLATEIIAAALHARKAPTRAYIPYIAMSGGTMVALATDQIWLGKNAALGPIGLQYYGVPIKAYEWVLQKKQNHVDSIDDRTLLLAFEAQKYARDANKKACALVKKAHKRRGEHSDGTCFVVDQLTNENQPHSERIDYDAADTIGMNVKNECPPEVYKMVDARLRMIQARQEQIHRGLVGAYGSRRTRRI